MQFIEPRYNESVEKLIQGTPDDECIAVISGFIAYVISCSPAGARIHSEGPRKIIENTGKLLEAAGKLPPMPKELGSDSFTQALRQGKVKIEIDPKYPQAMAVTSMTKHIAAFGNSKWEILINPFENNPFFTSDYPVGIEIAKYFPILNRVVPLAPNMAIRIFPDPTINMAKMDWSFSNFGWRRKRLSIKEVQRLNRLFVQCAEDLVLYRDDHPWVKTLVEKNRRFRIEPLTQQFSTGKGYFSMFSQRVKEVN